MKRQRFGLGLVLSVLLASQRLWAGGVAAAAEVAAPLPSPSASATPVASVSPSSSVAPNPSPSASPAPSVSPSPSVRPTASPLASPVPSESPSASPAPGGTDETHATGPGGCTGVVPEWVFDTAARSWQKADKGSFACDQSSGLWLSPKYYYDQRIGWYESVPAAEPKPSYLVTAPEVVHTVLGDLTVGSKDYELAQAMGLLTGGDGIVAGSTGSGSQSAVADQSRAQSWVDLTSLVNVVNAIQSMAISGAAIATSNTEVGDIHSGAASVVANLINLLASAWSWSNGDFSFFMRNIMGDQNGDITLAPAESATRGGGQLGDGVTRGGESDTVSVKAQASGSITNDVDLLARSGDATAERNTQAGNVGTGAATAQVNIINLINSMITSGSSFIGVLNILGNFNGDVLFSAGFLNGATASGAGAVSPVGVQGQVQNVASNGVMNNIGTVATSGAVTSNANAAAGAVGSGQASTTQSLFNLANTTMVGDNAVLVMVNVLGHWVGKIMGLPDGGSTEAALLTGNAQVRSAPDTVVTAKSAGTITNNVLVRARSGDATATRNTVAGKVASGDAKASSSVANLFNTVMTVKHWFGVLIINVLGDWTGDVNHDSTAGSGRGAATPTTESARVTSAQAIADLGLVVTPSPRTLPVPAAALAPTPGAPVAATAGSGRVLTAAVERTDPARAIWQGQTTNQLFGLSALSMLVAAALGGLDRRRRRGNRR